jgi:GDPmannose 4,6-dehydratase
MYARDRKDPIELGNMDAKRDWGHAKDYVKGMWQMMQEQESDDYVLATGETHSIRQLVETAFKYIGETVLWGGTEKNEEGYSSRGDLIVKVNPDFYRPAEVDVLCGDPRKAEKKFGWEREYTFENLISEMVEEDIDAIYKNKV